MPDLALHTATTINWDRIVTQFVEISPDSTQQENKPKNEMSYRRKLLYDRVRLIRGLQSYLEHGHIICIWPTNRYTIEGIESTIRQDVDSFLSYSQQRDGYVSYATKNSHKYDNNKRMRTRFGRYVRTQLKISEDDLPDRILEDIAYYLVGIMSDDGDYDSKIKLLEGNDIIQAYAHEVGCDSCMTGSNSKYVELYALNPDKVKLLVYDETRARALLWTCDDGTRLLDRIYPNSGVHVEILRSWAKRNNVAYRLTNGGEFKGFSDNESHQVTVKVDKYYPYMDSFIYGTRNKDGTVTLSDDDGDFHLVDGLIAGNQYVCCNCGGGFYVDDAYQADDGNLYCEDCYYERYSKCDSCAAEIYRDEAFSHEGELFCEDCFTDLFAYCEQCEEPYPKDDLHEIDDAWLCDYCYDKLKEQEKDD
jgi:hypothetical protein